MAPPPCPRWYADNEFNVSLWGTYIFTGNNWQDDRYLESDHAFGGGVDLKYFFHRYFGVGIEGWAVDARRAFEDIDEAFFRQTLVSRTVRTAHESRAVGSVLGTLTFRYPIPCTRFAPYLFAGGGGILVGAKGHILLQCRGSRGQRPGRLILANLELARAIPRQRQSGNLAVASKFALHRISAG